jgi:hypothetical protein
MGVSFKHLTVSSIQIPKCSRCDSARENPIPNQSNEFPHHPKDVSKKSLKEQQMIPHHPTTVKM